MRIVCACLIVAGLLLTGQHVGVALAGNLEFKISFDKEKHSEKDPILINFELDNKSKESLYVNKRFYLNAADSLEKDREIYLLVVSPSGEKLQCKRSTETGFPRTDSFVLLKPGEQISSDRARNIKRLFDFEAPGIYKITGIYHNVYGEEIGVEAYKKKIKSKPIKIEVIKEDEKKD